MSRRPKTKLFQGQGVPAAPANPPSFGKWVVVAICILLATLVCLVFGQTLGHQFVGYDDNLYVYDNPEVAKGITLGGIEWAFTHSHGGNWHPLTTISHMLDCEIFGLKPWGHHLTNVLLHAAAAILLFLVLRQMTGALWRSAFVAAVFAVHPLHVESVAWVAERKDVLSGLFFMLTLGAYACYAQRPASRKRYVALIALFAMGLMCKPTLVTLPFLLLLLDYWPLLRFQKESDQRHIFSIPRHLVVEKIPLFALSVCSCLATLLAQERAFGMVDKLTFPEQIGNALVSYAVYLEQMIYPAGLAVLYPHPANNLPVRDVLSATALLGLISTGVFAWRRKHPFLLVGWLWYLGMLAPMIGLIQAGAQAHADRYTYLPQIGLYIAVAWMCAVTCARLRLASLVPGIAMGAVIAALGVCARNQTSYWENDEMLWSHALSVRPDNAFALNNLGLDLELRGKTDEAIAHYRRALEINPGYPEAHNNLGNAQLHKGHIEEAIAQYRKALESRPDYLEAHNNMGNALLQNGQVDEAIAEGRKVLEINPNHSEAHNNLANALCAKGDVEEGISHYCKAIEIKPDYAAARSNLANALLRTGQIDDAITQLRKVLELNYKPAEIHYNLGNALLQNGRVDEAISHFQKALAIQPDFADAHDNLGVVLLQTGRVDEAISHLQKALDIRPGGAETHNTLGLALFSKGNAAEAASHYRQALKIQPDYADAQNNLAHVLATCPDASLRNGAEAVKLARQANEATGGGNPIILSTLAAAYAETGDFSDAVNTAQRALELVNSQSNAPLADLLRTQIALYKAGMPFRDKSFGK